MPPLFFIIMSPAVAILILWVLRRVVKNANNKVYVAQTAALPAQAKSEAAEKAHTETAGLAAQAMAQTGQALHVARTIDKVSEQMDLVVGYVTIEPAGHPRGRHARKTDSRDPEDSALPSVESFLT